MARTNGWAIIWAVAAAMLASFGQELAAGRVPISPEWRWLVPILVMGISAMSPYLKRVPPGDDE